MAFPLCSQTVKTHEWHGESSLNTEISWRHYLLITRTVIGINLDAFAPDCTNKAPQTRKQRTAPGYSSAVWQVVGGSKFRFWMHCKGKQQMRRESGKNRSRDKALIKPIRIYRSRRKGGEGGSQKGVDKDCINLSGRKLRSTPRSPPLPPSVAKEAGCLSSSSAEGSKLKGYSAETDLNLHCCALRYLSNIHSPIVLLTSPAPPPTALHTFYLPSCHTTSST